MAHPVNQIRTLFLIWALALGLGVSLDPWHEKQFLPPPEQQTKGGQLVNVFGEIKTVAARYLWFRMDLFNEALSEQGVASEDQTEVVALVRMVTLLDPSMTDSYDQLVYDLFRSQRFNKANAENLKVATELLQEGIRLNPNSFQLRFRQAFIHSMQKQDVEVIRTAARAFPLAEDVYEKTDILRLMYRSAERLGEVELQFKIINDLMTLRPEDQFWHNEYLKLKDRTNPK